MQPIVQALKICLAPKLIQACDWLTAPLPSAVENIASKNVAKIHLVFHVEQLACHGLSASSSP
jgi:hypothetical protein